MTGAADDTSPMGAEIRELQALRERAGALLDRAEAAVDANGRWRPGIARLCAELDGLRASLDDLTKRQIAVDAIFDAGCEAVKKMPPGAGI